MAHGQHVVEGEVFCRVDITSMETDISRNRISILHFVH